MSLRHALLALLDAGPMTGYELAKQFDVSAAYVWHAPHSQIYPELRRMEAAGLVVAQAQPRGDRATKRAYSVTADGADALLAWIGSPEAAHRPRDAAYLRATYFEYVPYDEARRQFREHREHHRALQVFWERHVGHLQRHETDLLRRRLAADDAEARDAVVAYKVHVYEGLVERARTEIAWAERGLDLVDRLEHGRRRAEPPATPHVLAD